MNQEDSSDVLRQNVVLQNISTEYCYDIFAGALYPYLEKTKNLEPRATRPVFADSLALQNIIEMWPAFVSFKSNFVRRKGVSS